MSKNITSIPQVHKISNKIYTNYTGKFPHRSSKGNHYIMVVYEYKANAILVEPLKNRSGSSLLATYEKNYKQLHSSGFQLKLHILDNKASADFKLYLRKNNIQYELVSPHTHQRNTAERAIQTFKITLFPVCVWLINLFQQFTCGTVSSLRLFLLSISYALVDGTRNFPHINSSLATLISTRLLLLLQEPKSLYTKLLTFVSRGHRTV